MEIFSPLVGVSFRGKEARAIITSLTPDDGDSLRLEAEPDNEYDDHAVKVLYADGTHLGYIARDNNTRLHELLMEGQEVEIKIVSFNSTIQPVLMISWDEEDE